MRLSRFEQREAEHFAQEARARHAAFHAQVVGGTLGTRTTILLVAAADAQLAPPTADDYRERLKRFVDAEILRLYPDRAEHSWRLLDPESRHHHLVDRVMREERYAREQVLRSAVLAERIDALPVKRLGRRVGLVHREVRARLSLRMAQGWTPDPARYRREVLEVTELPAHEAFR